MNPWLAALLGIIIGAILMFGVTRFKERRGGRRWLRHEALLEEEKRKHLANFEDFDIDYTRQVEPGFGGILQNGYGIMAGQCNNLNTDESYPYYCVRHKSHINHIDPKVRRHGYAGVFWD